MDAQISDQALSQNRLRKILLEARLRITIPRLEVLRVFTLEDDHLSADMVSRKLETRGIMLPRASVYNAIRDFKRAGILLPVELGSGRFLFEFAKALHPHTVCRLCGQIRDLPECFQPPQIPEIPEFKPERAQLVFYGICHDCSGLET